MKLSDFLNDDDDDDDRLYMTESTSRELRELGVEVPAYLKVTEVPDIEAREMTVLCLPGKGGRYFPDDVEDVCDRCKGPIHHRPHVPIGAIFVCTLCYLTEMAKKGKLGGPMLPPGLN